MQRTVEDARECQERAPPPGPFFFSFLCSFWQKNCKTRMHSSRMRTAHSLTVSHCILCTPPCNHPPTTMHTPPQPCMPSLQPCMPPWQPHMPPATTHPPKKPHTPQKNHTRPPVNRMTNRCKNITLPQTSFAGGNNRLAHLPPPGKFWIYIAMNAMPSQLLM